MAIYGLTLEKAELSYSTRTNHSQEGVIRHTIGVKPSIQERNGVPPLGKRIRMLAFSPTVQGARSKSVEQRAVASLILAITEVTIWQLLDFFLSSSLPGSLIQPLSHRNTRP